MSESEQSSIKKIGNWWSNATRGDKVVAAVLAVGLFAGIGGAYHNSAGAGAGAGGSIDTNSIAYDDGYYYGDGNLGSIDSPQSCLDRFNYVIGDGASIYNQTDHLTSGDKANFIAGCEKKQSGQ